MEVTLRIAGEEQVIKALDDLGDRARDLRKPFADFGERMVRKIARRLSGDALDVRSGRLRGSLTHEETADTAEISAGGGPGEVDYAAIHHYGGVIRPRKKKMLTIPFPGGPADQRVPFRARDFNDTFVAKGIIFRRVSKDEIQPLFILKKAVTIPARPYMYAEEADIAYLNDSIADFIAGA
jgi:phage gpG-like protein